jgi:hypothetical protein
VEWRFGPRSSEAIADIQGRGSALFGEGDVPR